MRGFFPSVWKGFKMLFNFYLKPVFIASIVSWKVTSHFKFWVCKHKTGLFYLLLCPFLEVLGENLQNLGEKAEALSKNVNLFPCPLIGVFFKKNYFAKNPTNFRCARMLHQFVKYVFPEPGRCGPNSCMLHTFELIWPGVFRHCRVCSQNSTFLLLYLILSVPVYFPYILTMRSLKTRE